MTHIITFIICITASTLGAVCGIGGGIIIKPLLDLINYADVLTVNFLSGCTVLSMTTYSILNNFLGKDKKGVIDIAVALPLATGAAAGGIAGKYIFDAVVSATGEAAIAGAVQAVVLAAVIAFSIWYTLNKDRITPRLAGSNVAGLPIGLGLGIMSSFLGIGGGPINLIFLFYFYGFETKKAVKYSLFIIFMSQLMNVAVTVARGNTPDFESLALVLMMAAGICGGIIGRRLNKRMDNKAVDKLFVAFQLVVVAICIVNFVKVF